MEDICVCFWVWSEVTLSGLNDWLCPFAHFSAFSNVMAARVTKSLDFQKYAMADPRCLDDWVIKLQILLKT